MSCHPYNISSPAAQHRLVSNYALKYESVEIRPMKRKSGDLKMLLLTCISKPYNHLQFQNPKEKVQ